MLSDVAAEQIARRRKAAGLTHRQLAERCAVFGWPALTASAISNIETGRRDKDGARRREVTVDELAVLARALESAPSLFLAPLGELDQVEVVPGRLVDTLEAYWWLTGRRTWYGTENGPDEPRGADMAREIGAYERHREAWTRYVAARVTDDHTGTREAWAIFQAAQQEMLDNGWRVPPTPSGPVEIAP